MKLEDKAKAISRDYDFGGCMKWKTVVVTWTAYDLAILMLALRHCGDERLRAWMKENEEQIEKSYAQLEMTRAAHDTAAVKPRTTEGEA